MTEEKKVGAELQGQPVLVTGATGFVGSHLTRRLLGLGAQVAILVRNSSNQALVEEFRAAGAKVHTGDISDREAVFSAMADVHYVFHIAALFRQAKHEDDVYVAVNVKGTEHVLDAAEKYNVKRLVHCSTVGVHSHIPKPPADENEAYRPADIYQRTKCDGEKLARARFESGRVNGVVIRPAMIWGEGDRRMLKLFKGVARKRFPIIGSGKTLTHWVYVHDLVNGMILAATTEAAKGQVFILAGRKPVELSALVEAIAKKAGVQPLPVKIPALPVQLLGSLTEFVCKPFGIEPPLYRRRVDFFTKDRCFSIEKAERELGYHPAQDVEAEVSNIYDWYKEHGWLDQQQANS